MTEAVLFGCRDARRLQLCTLFRTNSLSYPAVAAGGPDAASRRRNKLRPRISFVSFCFLRNRCYSLNKIGDLVAVLTIILETA